MKDKLTQMSNEKLVDVVKNFQRYGYDESVKKEALELLSSRGFNIDDLNLMGQEKTANFEAAKINLRQFNRFSWLAFIFYFLSVSVSIWFVAIKHYDPVAETVAKLCLYAVYITFMALSIVRLKNYYELSKVDDFSTDILIYVVVGMPLYIFAFFYIRSKLKEGLDRI